MKKTVIVRSSLTPIRGAFLFIGTQMGLVCTKHWTFVTKGYLIWQNGVLTTTLSFYCQILSGWIYPPFPSSATIWNSNWIVKKTLFKFFILLRCDEDFCCLPIMRRNLKLEVAISKYLNASASFSYIESPSPYIILPPRFYPIRRRRSCVMLGWWWTLRLTRWPKRLKTWWWTYRLTRLR